jgi:hypothetical protein
MIIIAIVIFILGASSGVLSKWYFWIGLFLSELVVAAFLRRVNGAQPRFIWGANGTQSREPKMDNDDERLSKLERELSEIKASKEKDLKESEDKAAREKRDRMLKARNMHFDSNREYWDYVNGKKD